jgi:hypothetical protein
MRIAGIDTFTAVMAILSVGRRSPIDQKCARRLLRYMGTELMDATPLTSACRAFGPSVRKAGGPAATTSAGPDTGDR